MQATLQMALACSTVELAVLVVVQVHSAGQVQASTPSEPLSISSTVFLTTF